MDIESLLHFVGSYYPLQLFIYNVFFVSVFSRLPLPMSRYRHSVKLVLCLFNVMNLKK